MRSRAALAAILLVTGCGFRAAYDDTHYKCGVDESCPGGYACVAGFCALGSPADAGADADPSTPDAAPSTARCGSLSLLVDDFAATTIDPIWSPFTDGPLQVTQTGGAVRIAIPAGAADVWGGYTSTYAYDLTGAQLAATIDQTGGKDTLIEVRNSTGGKAQLVVESGMIGAAVFGVAGESSRTQVAYQPAVHRHWRIRESNGMMYWETSPDGVGWNELWSEVLPFGVDHVRGQLAAGGQLGSASEARFGDVNLGAPAVLGLCGAQTLVDDFTALGPRWQAWASAGCTVSIVSGELVLASSAGSENYCGLDSEHLYDLTLGPIYADASNIASGASHVSFFQAVVPGDGHTRVEIDRDGDTIQFQQWVDNTLVTNVQFPYLSTDRYWRLKVNGTVVNLGTSPDGVTFTDRTNAALGFDATAVHIVTGAGHYASGSLAVNAKFRGINTP